MEDLEITGQSYRTERKQDAVVTQPPPSLPKADRGQLASALLVASKQSNLASATASAITSVLTVKGTAALLAGIKYMAEDHSLKVGVGELKDIVTSLGYNISQQDADALHAATTTGQYSSIVSPATAAQVFGLVYNDPNSRNKNGDPAGGYNADNFKQLVGIHAARHLEKAVTRAETRQHKHMLVIPRAQLLELLREKMTEHIPTGGGLLDAIRLFHHGHGTHISFVDFKTTIHTSFNLEIPEKRLRSLFSKFDHDGGGDISIDEFVRQVWNPNEKNKNSAVAMRENQQKAEMKRTMAKAQNAYEKSSLGHLDVDSAARMISEKLTMHLHAGGNELLQAFREFHHGHGMEIDRSEFVSTLKELGIKLQPPSEYDELFDHFDKTQTGTISFSEFCSEVMRVSSGKATMEGNRESGAERLKQKQLKRLAGADDLLDSNVDLIPILRERLYNHVDSGPMQITRAFTKFKQLGEGKSREGMTLEDFVPAVERLGMRINREQCEQLFIKIVGTKSTVLDLPSLRKIVFPADKNKDKMDDIGQHNHGANKLAPLSRVSQLKMQKKVVGNNTDMRELIRSRLMKRMSGNSNELLKAFRSFHPGHGLEISPSEFNGVVQNLLELKLPESELALMFGHIDTDGNGSIDYSEFVDEIMTGGKTPIMYGELRQQARVLKTQKNRKKYSLMNPKTARSNSDTNNGSGMPAVSPIKKRKIMLGPKLSNQGEKRWRQMNRAFMHEDLQHSGVISHSTFVHLLSSFNLSVDSQELQNLAQRYGQSNGIHYTKFMKDMRKMMSHGNGGKNNEDKNLPATSSGGSQEKKSQDEEASAILLDLIVRQWRQLQFSFSQHDRERTGHLDMRTIMNIMSKADPRVPGVIPFLVPKLRKSYSSTLDSGNLINYKKMIRTCLETTGHNPDMISKSSAALTTGRGTERGTGRGTETAASISAMTGRASDSIYRPLTWRLKDSLSRTHKANAIIGRIRLQMGSTLQRKSVLTQFEIRDSLQTNYIEKSILRSLFARLGIKVSAADVKGLSYCFEVPNQVRLFNYRDFMRVVERGF